MKSKLLLGALIAAVAAMPLDAAPKKKSRAKAKAKVTAVVPDHSQQFGTFAKLEGASWEESATGHILSYRWLVPGQRMMIEHDLPTGVKEESLIVRDPTTGDLVITHKDSQGKEQSSAARRVADGSIIETNSVGGTMMRRVYRTEGIDLLVGEQATLTGGVWQPGEKIQFKRLTAAETMERRSVAYREMMKRWGALAGLAGKSWRMELKGEELVQSFAWDVRGSILVQRDVVTGKDPAKSGRTAVYRYDADSGKIISSWQAGQSKPKSASATVETDGTVVVRQDDDDSNVTYIRLLGPNFYQADQGKVSKKGFKSKGQMTYALFSAQAQQARQQAEQAVLAQQGMVQQAAAQQQARAAAPAAAALAGVTGTQVADDGEKKRGKGLFGSILGAAGSILGGGGDPLGAALGGGGGGDLLGAALGGGGGGNLLASALGGGGGAEALAAALGGGGGGSDALSAAILAQSLGGGGGGLGGVGGGGGILGALTGKSGLGINLAAEALSALGGGGEGDAAGLRLMFAAIKAEDPGAMIQAMRMMEAAGTAGAAATSSAMSAPAAQAAQATQASSKGSVRPGSYPTRPNTLQGQPACRGYTSDNFKEYYAANQGGPDTQLHTMCAAAFNYYGMYRNAVKQGYSQADSNLTYGMFEKAAVTAIQFHKTAR